MANKLFSVSLHDSHHYKIRPYLFWDFNIFYITINEDPYYRSIEGFMGVATIANPVQYIIRVNFRALYKWAFGRPALSRLRE